MNILVTGATRGIGLYIALNFIKRGHKVFGVGRSWGNHEKTSHIKEKYNGMFIPIKCDISIEKEREKLFSYFSEKNIDIDVLVNNAGIGSIGEFQNINWEESRSLIDLNITALTHITKLFLDTLKTRKNIPERSGIINVSSTGAFQSGGPFTTVYYAGKSYVKSFTAGLYEELSPKGLRVMCLCPGPVKTDFKGMKGSRKKFYVMTPQETAEIAVRDYFNNKDISITGKWNKFFVFISKFIPRKKELKIIKKIQENKKT